MNMTKFLDRVAKWLAADDEPEVDGDAMRTELEPDLVPSTDPVKSLMRTEPWLD